MRAVPIRCALSAFLLFLPVAASRSDAQDWLQRAVPTDTRAHDFGTVARAANTEHRFVITNVLDKDMHIQSVRASCGCTTPIVENEVIKPGETGIILARFNTGTFTGQKQATLTVSIDQPFFTELQLNVKGYIRSDVVLSPGEVDFGKIPEGERKVVEVNLDYAGRSDWAINEISSSLPYVQATFEEVSRSAGRVAYKITTSLDADAPAGFLQNQLILHTNDRRLTTLPIRINASVESEFQISPHAIALGELKPGEPVQQRLVVKGRVPFRVLEITSELAEVRFDPILEPKPAHLINITIAPNTSRRGKMEGNVLLKTDLHDAPVRVGLSYTIVTQSSTEPQLTSNK